MKIETPLTCATGLASALYRVAPLVTLMVGTGASAAGQPIMTQSLDGPFATRTSWRLEMTQSPIPGLSGTGDAEPGAIMPCLRHAKFQGCDPALGTQLGPKGSLFDQPHYVRSVRVAYRRGGKVGPLLIVVLASVHAGDGGQVVGTQALAYDHRTDRFIRIFARTTGTNNNQEVRFIDSGALRGAFITVEPTADAPYGYWVTVARSIGALTSYKTVLRYRSATRYNDGNSLAVIDAEMPQILRRLSLSQPGQKLPLPASECAKPAMKHGALWCL